MDGPVQRKIEISDTGYFENRVTKNGDVIQFKNTFFTILFIIYPVNPIAKQLAQVDKNRTYNDYIYIILQVPDLYKIMQSRSHIPALRLIRIRV